MRASRAGGSPLARWHRQRVDARTGERLGQPGASAPQLDLVRLDQRHPPQLGIPARDQVRELAGAGADVGEMIGLAERRQGQQKLPIVFGLALGTRREGRVVQVVPVRMLPRRFHRALPILAALFQHHFCDGVDVRRIGHHRTASIGSTLVQGGDLIPLR